MRHLGCRTLRTLSGDGPNFSCSAYLIRAMNSREGATLDERANSLDDTESQSFEAETETEIETEDGDDDVVEQSDSSDGEYQGRRKTICWYSCPQGS